MSINITKESVHRAFCDLPEETKVDFAIKCAQYGVTPESIENLITGGLKSIEPFLNVVVENLCYWRKEDNNGRRL